MALNVYQTPVMVLGGITQDPYHLNMFQMPIMVLGTTQTPPANTQLVGAYGQYSISTQAANLVGARLLAGAQSQYLVSGQDASLVFSGISSPGTELSNSNIKNRTMLGIG